MVNFIRVRPQPKKIIASNVVQIDQKKYLQFFSKFYLINTFITNPQIEKRNFLYVIEIFTHRDNKIRYHTLLTTNIKMNKKMFYLIEVLTLHSTCFVRFIKIENSS